MKGENSIITDEINYEMELVFEDEEYNMGN